MRHGIDQLTRLSSSLRPTLRFLTPVQTTCNYVTLLFRNAASLLSDGDSNGTWQRFSRSSRRREGPATTRAAPRRPGQRARAARTTCTTNPYPNTAAPGQERECEAGNERYVAGQTVIGNPPGNQGT